MNTYNCLINGENQEIRLTEEEHHEAAKWGKTAKEVVDERNSFWKCGESDPRNKCGTWNTASDDPSKDQNECILCGKSNDGCSRLHLTTRN